MTCRLCFNWCTNATTAVMASWVQRLVSRVRPAPRDPDMAPYHDRLLALGIASELATAKMGIYSIEVALDLHNTRTLQNLHDRTDKIIGAINFYSTKFNRPPTPFEDHQQMYESAARLRRSIRNAALFLLPRLREWMEDILPRCAGAVLFEWRCLDATWGRLSKRLLVW